MTDMNMVEIYEKFGGGRQIKAAIIGGGAYSTAIVTQAPLTRYLTVSAIGDVSLEKARSAYEKAGISPEKVASCSTLSQARSALLNEQFVATDHPDIIFDLDVDVVADATGVPEAGACNAVKALEKGKHLVMINKETDSVIGPYLHKLFHDKGLCYSPVDGDQPAQLMQLVEWARMIGLEIICAGKARDGEYIYHLQDATVTLPADGKGVPEPVVADISPVDEKWLHFIPEGEADAYMENRARILKSLPGPGGFDYCELVNIANSTGLRFNQTGLCKCPLRVNEIPIVYTTKEHGGLMSDVNTLDIMTLLRTPEEASMGGGVFLVVRSRNDYSQHILCTKSLISNYDGSAAVMVQPYHLCGVESSTSLLTAAMLGVHTGARDRSMCYDIARVAKYDLPAGTICGHDRDENLETVIVPAVPGKKEAPIPAHLLNRNRLSADVKAGQIITYGMTEEPQDSVLWALRKDAEEYFFGER